MNPWIEAARPKTLSAGLVPVLVGSALAFHEGHFQFFIFLACLIGALSLQVATNYINDASDFLRGADTTERIGPKRMAQAGILTPKALFIGAGFMFLLATLAGVYLISQAGLIILAIGLFSILCATAYTAGPYPLAYYGLGDLFVMIFFGMVAVCGTYFAHTGNLSMLSFLCSLLVGFHSVAIIVVNNTRDIATDTKVGKKTMAVRLGTSLSKIYYQFILVLCYLIIIHICVVLTNFWLLLPILTFPLAINNMRKMRQAKSGDDYNKLLAATAKLQVLFCLLLSIALIFF